MKLKSITIEQKSWKQNNGFDCQICFEANENIRIYADVDEIVTAELIKVLIPIFEKISNQKFEEVVEETEGFLKKFNFRKKDCQDD